MRYASSRFLLFSSVIPIILLCISGCSRMSKSDAPPVVDKVDLKKYEGQWYEIARLPSWFQKNCIASEATYSLRSDRKVSVVNECLKANGEWKTAKGTAKVENAPANSKLTVIFDNWFSRLFPWLSKGDYWILDLDPGYQNAIVGTPDRKYLWIMAREPDIKEEIYRDLVAKSRNLGFDTERLIRRQAN